MCISSYNCVTILTVSEGKRTFLHFGGGISKKVGKTKFPKVEGGSKMTRFFEKIGEGNPPRRTLCKCWRRSEFYIQIFQSSIELQCDLLK